MRRKVVLFSLVAKFVHAGDELTPSQTSPRRPINDMNLARHPGIGVESKVKCKTQFGILKQTR